MNKENENGGFKEAVEKPPRASGKSAETRQRIFSAAVKVFTSYPYSAASIRMVAEEAGVRHPLVLHYFGSKLALFEEAAQFLEARVLDSGQPFLKNLKNLSSDEGFDSFLFGIVTHGFQRTDSYRAIMLNLCEAHSLKEALPGLNRISDVRAKAQKLVGGHVLGGAPARETEMFLFVFILSLAHFVGAGDFHKMALEIDDKDEYENWVLEAFTLLFRPLLKLLAGSRPEASGREYGGSLLDAIQNLKRPAEAQESMTGAVEAECPPKNGQAKSEETRRRIIRAARKVFSSHPYNAASIRMIGQAGNFDFTKIHHFYPTKEDLFEEFTKAAIDWRVGLGGFSVNEVFALYLKRALDYVFENPEAIGFLMHNIPQYERFRHLAGFSYIARFHARMLETVRALMPPDPREEMARIWLYNIITMVYTFAGSPDYLANLMGVAPGSDSYRQRIHEILLLVFLPSFLVFTNQT